MALKLITPPAVEPLDLATVITHLRVDGTEEDTLITSLITAAREYAEDYQSRALITQTWELILDCWPHCGCIEIPRPPLQSVTSIKYKDTTGAETTLDAADYIVDTDSFMGRVVLAHGKTWPAVTLYPAGGVRIRFVCGYGEAAAVPQTTKQAMLLLIAHWYENREAVVTGTISKEIEFAVKTLLGMNRVVPV